MPRNTPANFSWSLVRPAKYGESANFGAPARISAKRTVVTLNAYAWMMVYLGFRARRLGGWAHGYGRWVVWHGGAGPIWALPQWTLNFINNSFCPYNKAYLGGVFVRFWHCLWEFVGSNLFATKQSFNMHPYMPLTTPRPCGSLRGCHVAAHTCLY